MVALAFIVVPQLRHGVVEAHVRCCCGPHDAHVDCGCPACPAGHPRAANHDGHDRLGGCGAAGTLVDDATAPAIIPPVRHVEPASRTQAPPLFTLVTPIEAAPTAPPTGPPRV